MAKIAIITDTDSSLPSQMAAEFGIRQVPIGIHFTGESYTTGIDIDDRRLFEKVDKLSCLPTTSAPNPADFINVFEAAFNQGSEAIVCICVSKEASSTYDSAATACGQFPKRDIRIIDSLSMSMEQGFMALAAADAAKRDAGIDEIVARCGKKFERRCILMRWLSTLKYLAMSGRASKFVTGLADTFNIKAYPDNKGRKVRYA